MHALQAAVDEQLRDPDRLVGLRVARGFPNDDGMLELFFGKVVHRHAEPVESETSQLEPAWHIVYDDGDAEDMFRLEVLDGVARAQTGKLRRIYQCALTIRKITLH